MNHSGCFERRECRGAISPLPDHEVLGAIVNRKRKSSWPAIALTYQHLVRCDQQQQQDSTAGQAKPALERTRTQLASCNPIPRDLRIPVNFAADIDMQIHGRIDRGIPRASKLGCENSLIDQPTMRRLLCCLIAILVLFITAPQGLAQVHEHESENGTRMVRSLESLRDLDYDSWQAVAYREGEPGEPVVLRIVGYPGKLRMDHPVTLQVEAGRRNWALDDITLANPALATDGREAAAEFALDPLLDDLSNNRPLRLVLPGVFTELPVPPYVVGEWRSLQDLPLS